MVLSLSNDLKYHFACLITFDGVWPDKSMRLEASLWQNTVEVERVS